MSVHQCKKTNRWYVKYRVDGKQTSRWFGVGRLEKKNAEAFDYDLKALRLHKYIIITSSYKIN